MSKHIQFLSKENKCQTKLLTDSHGRGLRNLLSGTFDSNSVICHLLLIQMVQ